MTTIKFTGNIWNIGGSKVVTIPKQIVDKEGLEIGAPVSIQLKRLVEKE